MISKKIAFVTNSFEKGRSGVGDVTRHLAMELARQGHRVLLLGINDEHRIRVEPLDEYWANGGIRCVRFSAQLSWPERVVEVRSLLSEFQPDLLSWQFVSYAYDSRGITFGVNRYLQAISEGWPVHIMFHELWIGQEMSASLRDRLSGWLQRESIRAFLRRIQPLYVHTNNPTYVEILQRVGIASTCLPLPSAIEISPVVDRAWFFKECQRVGLVLSPNNIKDFWLFGFFGTLHTIWPPQPLLKYIRAATAQAKKYPIFCSLGHLGPGEKLWDGLALENADWSSWIKFGALNEETISSILQQMDYGVATTPWEIIGKSSSATTMIEHGLPVLVNRCLHFGLGTDDLKYPDPLLIQMSSDLPRILSGQRAHGPVGSRTPEVATKFLADCFGEAE